MADFILGLLNPTGSMLNKVIDEVKVDVLNRDTVINQESTNFSTMTDDNGQPINEAASLGSQTGDTDTLENVEGTDNVDRGKVLQMESKSPIDNSINMSNSIKIDMEEKVIANYVDPQAIVQENADKLTQDESVLRMMKKEANVDPKDLALARSKAQRDESVLMMKKEALEYEQAREQENRQLAAGGAALAVGAVGIGLGISALNRKRKKEDDK